MRFLYIKYHEEEKKEMIERQTNIAMISIPIDLRQELKVYAALKKQTMQKAAEEAIREKIEKEKVQK